MRREKKKKGERESRGISATLLPKFLCHSVKKKAIAATPLPKKEKINVLVIVVMPLPKMEKKKMKSMNE